MSTPQDEQDAAKKPEHGPYGELVWLADKQKWHRRLTDEGKEIARKYLEKYPNPSVIIKHKCPKLYESALRRNDPEDLNQAATLGVMTGISKFDPARVNPKDPTKKIKLKTYLFMWIKSSVAQMCDQRPQDKEEFAIDLTDDGTGDKADRYHPAMKETPQQAGAWDNDTWERVFAPLDDKLKQIMLFKYRDRLNLEKVARIIGTNRGTVADLQAQAEHELRVHYRFSKAAVKELVGMMERLTDDE